MSSAFITGITGQDGSYLAELLLSKHYKVIGLVSSKHDIGFHNINSFKNKLVLEQGDLLDQNSIINIIKKHKPSEIYNLAGLTFVPDSWERPTLALDINLLGVTRILQAIHIHSPETKFYQASSSKMFGNGLKTPQNESTPLNPLDPYSISKTAGFQIVKVFRDHFNLFLCNGILFNHESERRGPEFVTRKITHTAAKIKLKMADQLILGDLDAKQDWGYAPDYVQAMWLMLQQPNPDDFVVATGKLHSVRQACQIAFDHLKLNYQDYVTTDEKFMRKESITAPLGDFSKARKILDWQPRTTFKQMIVKMVENDVQLLEQEAHKT